jgi:hypothetical protein
MPARSKKNGQVSRGKKIVAVLKRPIVAVRKKSANLISRRPHRSFKMTRRRDYARSLKLPGYFAFTHHVNRTLRTYRKPLILLAIFYAVTSAILVGIASQDNYTALTGAFSGESTELFQGTLEQISKAGLILGTIVTTGISDKLTEGQQIYAALLGLLVWLTTVWLLRNLLAGHNVRLRDGLYNAGAPLISTVLVSLVLIVQLLPVGIAAIAYAAASTAGLVSGGVEAMLFWVIAILLLLLSTYWISATFFALIIVTLPGMYPMQALRTAGDMVVGRRIRIILRLGWMILCLAVAWLIVMIPVILLDSWLKGLWMQIASAPIIPIVLLIMTTLSIIWAASYMYLLYRKVVDDDAKPA